MNVLYHPSKANVEVDALNKLSMGSVAHVKEERKELAKYVHRLARLGVCLTDTSNSGVIVQNGSESSLIAEKGLGTQVNLSTTFYPQMDGQAERTIQTLEDILRSCVINSKGVTYEGAMRFGKKVKLSPRYVGPYKILKRVGNVAYELEFPTELAAVYPVFHISLLKKCVGDQASLVPLESGCEG
ncbi:hypothetical protein MTR67_035471 [Solanum verrucosum]|uniref:Tf2-1-like SH3-like domain-containing protein n=1 Tax=Solanum verrucosum TaxID=315347 RepID=A0AAF0UAM6_SOLVR|nr:hypothetical protein MTR67_035471 [Solanum verrucosum]